MSNGSPWITSSYCDSAGPDCLAVDMNHDDGTAVRVLDTKHPHEPPLVVSRRAWTAFVGSATHGDAELARNA